MPVGNSTGGAGAGWESARGGYGFIVYGCGAGTGRNFQPAQDSTVQMQPQLIRLNSVVSASLHQEKTA